MTFLWTPGDKRLIDRAGNRKDRVVRRYSVKICPKNFAKFIGKHLFWSPFLLKFQAWRKYFFGNYRKVTAAEEFYFTFSRNLLWDFAIEMLGCLEFIWTVSCPSRNVSFLASFFAFSIVLFNFSRLGKNV